MAASANPAAKKILQSFNTITSPSSLPQIQTQILIHNLLPDTTMSSSFITTCSSLGLLPVALRFFSLLRRPHTFICHSLLRALHLHRRHHFSLFSRMHRLSIPFNNYSFPLALAPIARLRDALSGSSLHAHVLKSGHSSDPCVTTSLLKFYSSCGEMDGVEKVFDEMPQKGVVAWSALIMGYHGNQRSEQTLVMFERMQFPRVAPNRVTMVSALAACVRLGAVDTGVWIHLHLVEGKGLELDVVLGTSLVDMYFKCGRVEDGMRVFESMEERNVCAWNSVIGGLARSRNGEEAVRWFGMMKRQGVRPDPITITGVLCACSRSGMVEIGQSVFRRVVGRRYGFGPSIEHYGCIIDLLGRASRLDSAMEYVERMPYEPNVVIWGSMLGACRARGEMALAELAAGRLVALEPENVAHYVALSRVFADMGRWSDVEEVRRVVKEMGMRKDGGLSTSASDGDQESLEPPQMDRRGCTLQISRLACST